MSESIPKRPRKRKSKQQPTDALEPGRPGRPPDEPRRSLAGDPERDADARRELDELERAEREQRRRFEGQPGSGRLDAEE